MRETMKCMWIQQQMSPMIWKSRQICWLECSVNIFQSISETANQTKKLGVLTGQWSLPTKIFPLLQQWWYWVDIWRPILNVLMSRIAFSSPIQVALSSARSILNMKEHTYILTWSVMYLWEVERLPEEDSRLGTKSTYLQLNHPHLLPLSIVCTHQRNPRDREIRGRGILNLYSKL